MDLKKEVIGGVKWSTLTTVVSTLLQFLQTVILARLVTPKDFGLMAILYVIIGFAGMISDFGISSAVIQKQDTSSRQLSSLYWLNIAVGFFLFIILYYTRGFFAAFYDEPLLNDLIPLVGINLLVTPVGAQFGVILRKNLRFNLSSKISLLSILFSFAFTVGLAYYGYGVYSLVYGAIVYSTVIAVGSFIYGLQYNKLEFEFNFPEIKPYLKFGIYNFSGGIVNYLSANVDKLIIGRILGAELLGIYTIAYNISLLPISKINPVVTNIAFPVFSKIQNDQESLNSYYTKAVILVMLINVPILAGLSIVSTEFITVVYGTKWILAAGILPYLAAVGLFRAFGNVGGALVLAKGKPEVILNWNLILLAGTSFVTYLVLLNVPTLQAAGFSQLLVMLLFGWLWHFFIQRVAGISYKPILLKVFVFLVIASIMAIVVGSFNSFNIITSPLIGLIIKSAVGGVVFLSIIYFVNGRYIDLRSLKL